MSELIAAAERHAEAYADDDRQDIKTDVLNAFYAGAKFAGERIAELERELANLTATLNAERGLAGACGLASRTLIVKYKTELVAAQATISRMREHMKNAGSSTWWCQEAERLVALPAGDRTALDAMLAEERKQQREVDARICEGVTKTPETNGLELTIAAYAIRQAAERGGE